MSLYPMGGLYGPGDEERGSTYGENCEHVWVDAGGGMHICAACEDMEDCPRFHGDPCGACDD